MGININCQIYLQNIGNGAKETAQSIPCLMHKYKDLRLGIQNPCKKMDRKHIN